MRANATMGLSEKMKDEMKAGFEVESQSVDYVFSDVKEVFRKLMKFHIDETGSASQTIY